MQLIQFEGRTVAVIAPEDLENLEHENANMRKAGDAMAEYLAPGPIPTHEPTERDFLLADWEQAKS